MSRHHPNASAHVIVPAVRHGRDPNSDGAVLQQALGQLWQAGVTIDWVAFHADERVRRVPLPTYPFEKQRYWIEPSSFAASPVVRDLFHVPQWKLAGKKRRTPGAADAASWLVVMDDKGLGQALVDRLRRSGETVITAVPGDTYVTHDETSVGLDIRDEGHYRAWIKAQVARGMHVDHVVHLAHGYDSLLHTIKAVVGEQLRGETVVHAVTHDAWRVTGTEALDPMQSMVAGLCRVAPQEHAQLRCQQIDVAGLAEMHDDGLVSLADDLFEALHGDERDVALRHGQRWIRGYASPGDLGRVAGRIRQGGVYVITGGLGKLGLAIAKHLAVTYGARLVLIARRSAEPTPSALHNLEKSGAEIIVCRADVSSESEMADAFRIAEERFGAIHGVIHAAGHMRDALRPFLETTIASSHDQFAAKVSGTCVIEALVRDRDMDFCLLMSSLSSVLGGLGFAAYAAANCYMDAFAQKMQADGSSVHWISVNWDGWHMGDTVTPGAHGMRLDDGMRALELALSFDGAAQVVNATGDFRARLERWVDLPIGMDAGKTAMRMTERTDGVAPRNEIEERLRHVWQELTGIDTLGVHDDFFELGGDSLLATRLLNRVRQDFPGAAYPIRAFFEAPTIAKGAEHIAASLLAKELDDKMRDVTNDQNTIEEGVFQ
jgi:acyl transferase domain-containing protein